MTRALRFLAKSYRRLARIPSARSWHWNNIGAAKANTRGAGSRSCFLHLGQETMKALRSVALQTSSDSKSHPKDQLGRHTHAESEPDAVVIVGGIRVRTA